MVEFDRGTTWGNTLKTQTAKDHPAIQYSAFQELFGVSSVTVAIATTDKKRVDLMRSFIQAELQRLGLMHLAHVFLFTPLPEELEPKDIFTLRSGKQFKVIMSRLLDLNVE